MFQFSFSIDERIKIILLRFLCLFIPLSRWRKQFRKRFIKDKDIFKELLSFFPYPYYLSKQYPFSALLPQKTLIIGSSHAMYGFIPDDDTINLGMASQDLYYSWKLYEKYVLQMPSLTNIVLFYSVFSPGFQLDKSSEFSRCAAYRLYFDIDYLDLDKSIIQKIEKVACKYHHEIAGNAPLSTPKLKPSRIPNSLTQEIAEKHLKHNCRSMLQNAYVQKIITLAKEKKQRLFIVLSPAREDYRRCLPDKSELFKFIYQTATDNPQIKLVDFYDDKSFINDDFSDNNHLFYSTGAKKLTDKLIAIIKEAA